MRAANLMDYKRRLKCPVCNLEYAVAGIAALGVTDGGKRPCSWQCEKRYNDSESRENV